MANVSSVLVENTSLESTFLEREVKIDFYYPKEVADPSKMSLLLINDGQDLVKLSFENILDQLYQSEDPISPLFCVGIHCGPDRKMEYGVSDHPDYKGRGARAGLYTSFVFEELLPFVRQSSTPTFKEKAFAGFSLGGLMALDIAWQHPAHFNKVGVFSGSLWWRDIDQDDEAYDDDKHRIMHQRIRHGQYAPWLKFFFQCGNMDETKDRNNNGIIDSIDDTLDMIKELVNKGYDRSADIHYLEMPDGRHDVPTWGRALPEFLRWGWGREK